MTKKDTGKVFSHRIRKLSGHELDKVVGGSSGGLKRRYGMDNMQYDFH